MVLWYFKVDLFYVKAHCVSICWGNRGFLVAVDVLVVGLSLGLCGAFLLVLVSRSV